MAHTLRDFGQAPTPRDVLHLIYHRSGKSIIPTEKAHEITVVHGLISTSIWYIVDAKIFKCRRRIINARRLDMDGSREILGRARSIEALQEIIRQDIEKHGVKP